jgi:hypothetical protein
MNADQIRQIRIFKELDDAGVVVTELPGQCLRLVGAYGVVMLTTSVLNLTHRDIARLCLEPEH